MSQRKYGWNPDRPDHRDRAYAPRVGEGASLPPSFSQRPYWPAPYNQGQLGSCTGNGVAGVCHYRLVRQGEEAAGVVNTPSGIPSRLFIYYFERLLEGTVGVDSGAAIRDGIRVVASRGFCFENFWPYDDGPRFFRRRPNLRAQRAARRDVVKQYARINNASLSGIAAIKQAISDDHPVVFGCSVYESFESQAVAVDGIVPYPAPGEQPLGGHCMVVVGWDDYKQIGGEVGAFEVRNSWGADWGDGGYCWMPYAYLTNGNLASDFWVVTAVP